MSTVHRISGTIIFLALSGTAQGAEFEVHPSIAVNEEYTDNVFETRNNRISDFITRALPGIALTYKAPALEGNLSYLFDYRYYARRSRGTDSTHVLSANGRLTAVGNILFLDVTDEYRRVSLDVTRDVVKESLFLNQSDQNVMTVSPFLVLRLDPTTTMNTGYRFVDTRYFESPGIDKTNHVGFAEMTHEFSRKWKLNANYHYTLEEAQTIEYTRHDASVGSRYEYSDTSFIFGNIGNSWIRYDNSHKLNNILWSAGISHTFDTLTASFNTSVTYDEDPLRNITQQTNYRGELGKRFHNGSLGLNFAYSEFIITETNTLNTKKYSSGIKTHYEFSRNLTGNLSFLAERYNRELLHSYTRRLLSEADITYLTGKDWSVALNYVNADYYSAGIPEDNKQVNRVSLEIKKRF